MNLDTAEQIANELLLKYGLHDWSFQYNYSKTVFGLCDDVRRIIYLSLYLTYYNNEYHVVDTLLHEVSHSL
jgi:hypothetical protein